MATTSLTPIAVASCVEHSLHLSLPGFDVPRARLYGISVVDPRGVERNVDGALRLSYIAEHPDVYSLLANPAANVVRFYDAAAVLTCGWAAPVAGDDDDDRAPSEHPQRRRVRLVSVVCDAGAGSVLRFADSPDEVITDAGDGRGSLADAINHLWRD